MNKKTKNDDLIPSIVYLPKSYWKVLRRIKEKQGIPMNRQIRMALSKVCEA